MNLRDHIVPFAEAPKDWRPTWLIEHVWQDEGVNFLFGPPKRSRKSTLRRYLIACAFAQQPAFGTLATPRPIQRACVMLIEDHPGTERRYIEAALKAFGVTEMPAIDFLTPFGFHLDNPQHLRALRNLADEEGYELICLDPLIEFHSADENLSTEMARVTIALRELAEGRCVAVTHHVTKPSQDGGFSTRTIGESMRGSSVLAGAANVAIRAIPSGSRVKLAFETKLSAAPEALEVELDEQSGLWHLAAPLTEDVVLETLRQHHGLTRDELVTVLRRRRDDVLKLVNTMQRNNLITQGTANGTKYLYAVD